MYADANAGAENRHSAACVADTIDDILKAHRSGERTPEDTVAQAFARIRAHADPAHHAA
jgi:hypothetical protein